MHEIHPGLWAPVPTEQAGRFVKELRDGLPAHSAAAITACVEACGSRRRTAIDGGAYVGTWSLHLARHFSRVIAFEPVAENYSCLRRNVKGLNVDVVQEALTDYSGPMEIYSRAGAPSKPFNQQVRHTPGAVWASCHGQHLDEKHYMDIDFIKLDVEGHEFQALLGAQQTIRTCRPVVIIEEKLDPDKRASQLLAKWGMTHAASFKHDQLFIWKENE